MIGKPDNELQMSSEEFTMIRDFIHEKSGIYFAENKTYLIKNRLATRMAELEMKTVRDYFYHVKYDVSLKEFNHLMDLITTNETSFFRNEPQLLSFSEEVLPQLIESKIASNETKSLKIWSAGCSTGEEPYTLAILILEKLKTHSDWNIEIIANDISEQVLQVARAGEYSGLTLRNMKPEILSRYFTKNGDKYRVKPEIKSLVKFSQINLNDPRKISFMSNADVTFCRNVMIYFSDDVKRQLVRGFYNSLRPGGYFYIGHSETLHGISKAFKLVYLKNALVYNKEVTSANSERKPASSAGGVGQRVAVSVTNAGTRAGDPATGALRAMDLLSKINTKSAVK